MEHETRHPDAAGEARDMENGPAGIARWCEEPGCATAIVRRRVDRPTHAPHHRMSTLPVGGIVRSGRSEGSSLRHVTRRHGRGAPSVVVAPGRVVEGTSPVDGWGFSRPRADVGHFPNWRSSATKRRRHSTSSSPRIRRQYSVLPAMATVFRSSPRSKRRSPIRSSSNDSTRIGTWTRDGRPDGRTVTCCGRRNRLLTATRACSSDISRRCRRGDFNEDSVRTRGLVSSVPGQPVGVVSGDGPGGFRHPHPGDVGGWSSVAATLSTATGHLYVAIGQPGRATSRSYAAPASGPSRRTHTSPRPRREAIVTGAPTPTRTRRRLAGVRTA